MGEQVGLVLENINGIKKERLVYILLSTMKEKGIGDVKVSGTSLEVNGEKFILKDNEKDARTYLLQPVMKDGLMTDRKSVV